MIYRAALISPKPIDLWPHKYVKKPEEKSALDPRLAKLSKGGNSETDVPSFRQQVSSRFHKPELNILLRKAPTDSLLLK
jgi:hypothetical protein